jgi:hypothetical protein
MPQSACVLVRIAVSIRLEPCPAPIALDPTVCPHCGLAHHCRADDAPPNMPGVTLEMAAFYREHPEDN